MTAGSRGFQGLANRSLGSSGRGLLRFESLRQGRDVGSGL